MQPLCTATLQQSNRVVLVFNTGVVSEKENGNESVQIANDTTPGAVAGQPEHIHCAKRIDLVKQMFQAAVLCCGTMNCSAFMQWFVATATDVVPPCHHCTAQLKRVSNKHIAATLAHCAVVQPNGA